MISRSALGTDVNGNLIDNDTWAKANSPYNIVGDVGVPSGLTLTIEAGVEINYTGDFRILVFGTIKVEGTASDSVYFNGNNVKGTKYMLEVRKTNLDESKIDYVVFEGPQGSFAIGTQSDVTRNTGIFKIKNSSFTNTALFKFSSIQGEDPFSKINLTSCILSTTRVYSNGQDSVEIQEEYSVICNFCAVVNSEVEWLRIQFIRSTIRNVDFNHVHLIRIVDSNVIASNIGLDESNLVEYFSALNSIFYDSPIIAQWRFISSYSLFIENQNKVNSTVTFLSTVEHKVDFSSFINNSNNSILINGPGDKEALISNCTFFNSIVGIKSLMHFEINLKNNNFFTPINYNVENNSTADINAQNNYWNSDSPTIISSTIYDQNDNLELGLVDFSNFLTEPSTDAPISPPRDVAKTEDSDGELNITWSANPESDLSSYQIHYGKFDGFSFANTIDVGNVTSYNISGLSLLDSVAITALDIQADGADDMVEGHESWFAFVPDHPFSPPTITSFSPESGPIGNVVTITGTNFSTTPSENIVYFGATKASVTTAATTELTVTVPSGTTYEPISVLNKETGFIVFSSEPFVTTFGGEGINAESFADRVDFVSIGGDSGGPHPVATGDFDGDGKVDLAVGDTDTGIISILKNQTSEPNSLSFGAKIDYGVGFPTSITTGDFNADGLLDLVVTNLFSSRISVFRNTSSGTGLISFASKLDLTTGEYPQSITINDFNKDGLLDIAVVNAQSNTLSIFINTTTKNETLNFKPKLDFTTGSEPHSIASCDFNNDKLIDLVVANYGSNTISVFRNLGNDATLFTPKFDLNVGVRPINVTIGYLDQDQLPDIVVVNQGSNTISTFRNSTSSVDLISFATKKDVEVGQGPIFSALSDLDGDQFVDLISVNQNENTISVIKNKSTGIGVLNFESRVDFPTGESPISTVIADFNQDDKSDIIVAQWSAAKLGYFKNTMRSSTTTEIISFSFPEQSSAATINISIHTINITVGSTTNLTILKASFTLSAGATAKVGSVIQTSGVTINDFTSPVTYTITAEDGVTNQDWVVTVNNEGTGNNAPSISNQSFSINENSSVGTTVGTVTASDFDGDNITFSITNGNTGNAFSIGSSTGSISVSSQSALDYETTPIFPLTISVNDGQVTSSATITINLLDVSEGSNVAPTISNQSFTVLENSSTNTLIGTVLANDNDGDLLAHRIISGNTNNAFKIESSTGQLIVNNTSALDFELQEVQVIQVEISDGQAAATASITINITNQEEIETFTIQNENLELAGGYGESIKNYSLISFPFKDPIVGSQLNELGTYNKKDWRLFRLVPDSEAYEEYQSGFEIVQPGVGYWFIQRNSNSITVGGSSVEIIDGVFKMDLTSGYNLMGNPFNGTLNWGEVIQHNISEGIISIVDIRSVNRTELYVWRTAWLTESNLNSYEGGYIYANIAIQNFEIPYNASSRSGRSQQNSQPSPQKVSIDNDQWEINFYIHSPEYDYYMAGVGLNPAAKDAIDSFDGSSIPRFTKHLEVIFDDGSTKSIKAADELKSWSFSIPNNLNTDQLSFSWDQPVSVDKSIILVEEGTGKFYDLSKDHSVNMSNNPSAIYSLYYGNKHEIFKTFDLTHELIGEVYPNPCKERINFSVFSSSDKIGHIELLSLSGKNVMSTQVILSKGGNNIDIDLEKYSLSKGIYILKFNNSIKSKLIKQ
jgi:hypothetical protein